VSFDIFLQGFIDGEPTSSGSSEALEVIQAHLPHPPQNGFARIRTADGEADVYGLDSDGLMITHASGDEIWELIVKIARAARWIIMPVGCPACAVDPPMIGDLPDGLRESAVLVTSGADLRAAILSA
jgi:hypothetical protein